MPLPGLVVSGQLISASHINAIRNFLSLMTDGSPATPGLRFEDDPDTGFHRSGANALDIIAGGAMRLRVSASAVTISLALDASTVRIAGASARGVLDAAGVITVTNGANVASTDFTALAWTTEGGGAIGWNKASGEGELALICISGGGSDGGVSIYDRNTQLARFKKSGQLTLTVGTETTDALRISAATPTKFSFFKTNETSDQTQIGHWNGASYGQVRLYGTIAAETLPGADPGVGSKQFWYDPADGNRVKYRP
jgi:hypothetical protein